MLDKIDRKLLALLQELLEVLAYVHLRGVVHLALQLLELAQIHLALDIRLDVVHIALGAADQGADGARHLGQFFRADHHQRHHADDRQFAKADVEHGGLLLAVVGVDVDHPAAVSGRLARVFFAFHAVLEALDRAAQILADIAQLTGGSYDTKRLTLSHILDLLTRYLVSSLKKALRKPRRIANG